MAFTVKKQANLKFKNNTTFKIPRTGSGAPSLIPADAQSIIVTFADRQNMLFDRVYLPQELANLDNYPLWYRLQPYGIGYGYIWNLTLESIFDIGNYSVVATNPSDDASIIPTTGWTYVVGNGFPVVITAA